MTGLAVWEVQITSVKIAPTTHLHLRVEAKGASIDLFVIPHDGAHIISLPTIGVSISATKLHDENYLYMKLVNTQCNSIEAASVANALSVFAEYRDRIQNDQRMIM